MSAEPAFLGSDLTRLRRRYDRSAIHYDRAAALAQEVCSRLLQHLEGLKPAPQRILDAGSGTGGATAALQAKFPEATLISLDASLGMLRQAHPQVPRGALLRAAAGVGTLWPFRRPAPITRLCADLEHLPLAPASIGLVWSNLALGWGRLPAALAEAHRVLEPDGLLIFSTFGPDTLRELRQAFTGVDGYAHVMDFPDMHDVGDLLVHGGFANPVMDMEVITLTYGRLEDLLEELRVTGGGNPLAGRRHGLMGRVAWSRLKDGYQRWRKDGALPATVEIVYGHAWKPAARRMPDGRPVIPLRAERIIR